MHLKIGWKYLFFFLKTTKQKHCSLINISVFWRSGRIPQKCIIIALGLEYLSHREYYTHTYIHQMCVLLVGDRLLWQGQCWSMEEKIERDLLSCIEVHPKRASISQELHADLSNSQKCHWRFKAKKSSRI